MATVKLTKSELRVQQQRLVQLQKYLPTLHLKKSLLQTEVNEAKQEIVKGKASFQSAHLSASQLGALLSEQCGLDLTQSAMIEKIITRTENIAGVNIPLFESVHFFPFEYALFGVPAWVDSAVYVLRHMAIERAKLIVMEEKKAALEKELREVTIRVNLFEKNLIPRAQQNIKKIKIFLGDQQLAAIAQAKVAKKKIEKTLIKRRSIKTS